MTINIAINGLGRIGRLVYRLASKRANFNIVAVNDIVDPEQLAYLLKYDSVHGKFPADIYAEEGCLITKDMRTQVFSETDPEKLPWKDLDIHYVVESTGKFTSLDLAGKHLNAGAKKVIISAPGKGGVPTFAMGVNHQNYDPEKDHIVSNASCTTNCLAPLTKVLLDNFGIQEGLMTTVHAVTASQPTVDGPSKKDWRGGRSAGLNIIPATTGAAKAVALCLPEVEGKLTGMALRVPVCDVSVVDLTVKLKKSTSYEEICDAVKAASEGPMEGILAYTDEAVVSSDFIGSTYSSIFDAGAGIALNDKFYKLIAWYDNEMGYAARVVDLLSFMASQE